MTTALVFAFTAGAVATVNPCGFALLPVWFAKQLAGREGDRPRMRVLRAGISAGAATLGFVGVFALAGLIIGSGAGRLGPVLPYVGVAIGGGLVISGLAALFAIRLPGFPGLGTCRRIGGRFGAFGFGLSYGAVSLSCTLPIFMAVAGVSFLAGSTPSFVNISVFLFGAASVLVVVSGFATLLGAGVFTFAARHQGALRRFSGALTLLAGVYVFFFWEVQIFGEIPIVRTILNEGGYWGAMAAQTLSQRAGPTAVVAVILAVVLIALAILGRVRRAQGLKDR